MKPSGSSTSRDCRGSEDELVGKVERLGLRAVDVGHAVVAGEVAGAVTAPRTSVDIWIGRERSNAAARELWRFQPGGAGHLHSLGRGESREHGDDADAV